MQLAQLEQKETRVHKAQRDQQVLREQQEILALQVPQAHKAQQELTVHKVQLAHKAQRERQAQEGQHVGI